MYGLERCRPADVAHLFHRYHVYGSVGSVYTDCFACVERDEPVAAFVWQPPPPQAAKQVCPSCPSAVLALSRMVAVPAENRTLRHISKPLKYQMKRLLDRTRWPTLVTYSDLGMGHTGHVYKCSGWLKDGEPRKSKCFADPDGNRRSSYNAGNMRTDLEYVGDTLIQRWLHRWVDPGEEAEWMAYCGWARVQTKGVWRSGNPKYTWVKTTD